MMTEPAFSDDLDGRPVEAPPPPPTPPKRSVRRPARGRDTTAPRSRTRKAPAKPTGPSPEEGIRGLIQIPAGGLILAGQKLGSIPLVADGATLLFHGPALAEATVQLAETDPRIMALIEKLVAFGPYGMFFTVVFSIAVQGARNHEAASPALLESFGAVTPEEIINKVGMEIEVQVSPNGQATDGNGTPPEN